ncbi:MAG: HNH endonuclease, partial [Sulfitobacter sp.]|nr:HNH endonuclease [Sulfitobacter sp.]
SELYGDGEPYWDEESGSTLDWRSVGVTAHMVLALCKRHNIPVNILWHNGVVESFTPTDRGRHDLTSQAMHIRGDHAFFYADAQTKRWITRHDSSSPAARPSEIMQIAPRQAESSMSDWKPLPEEVHAGLEGEFWAPQPVMHQVRADLLQLGICPKVYLSGASPHSDVRRLIIKTPGKKQAVTIHAVHPDHEVCAAFVELLNAQTGGSLKYCGSSPGATVASAFEELCRPQRRQEWPPGTREAVISQQQALCADCGDELDAGAFELDHRVPLCFGGLDELENLAAVCGPCHAHKSYHETMGHVEDRNPLVSRFNRETHRAFVLSRKPPQMVANVHAPQEGQTTVQADVIRCRFTQFMENDYPLPVFCALDEVVPAT